MTDPATLGFAKAYAAADKLGLVDKLLRRLVNSPDDAAKHLTVALSEVRRTFDALRDTLLEITYLGVPGQNEFDIRRTLDRIEHGKLFDIVIAGKGSCSKIANIYRQHLSGWFHIVFNTSEQSQLQQLFADLADSDGWAIDAAQQLLTAALPVAVSMRQSLDSGDQTTAIATARAFAKELRPALDRISATVGFMGKLEVEFITHQGISA